MTTLLLDGLAEEYRKKQKRLAELTARKLTMAFKTYNKPKFVIYATKEIQVANAKAANLARQYTNTARRAYSLDPIPLPATVEQDAKMIAQAASTAFGEGQSSVTRLARSEPLWAAQKALSEAAAAMGRGWVRHTGPSPCAICRKLADGKVRGPMVPMAGAHPNCSCVQVFVEEPWSDKKPRRTRKAAPRRKAPAKAVAAKKTPAKKTPAKATALKKATARATAAKKIAAKKPVRRPRKAT